MLILDIIISLWKIVFPSSMNPSTLSDKIFL